MSMKRYDLDSEDELDEEPNAFDAESNPIKHVKVIYISVRGNSHIEKWTLNVKLTSVGLPPSPSKRQFDV